MGRLFNRTFFRFTIGFVGIILFSLIFAIAVENYDATTLPASANIPAEE